MFRLRCVVGALAGALSLATSGGCGQSRGDIGDEDPGNVRAKVSACRGYSVESTIAYMLAAEGSVLAEARSCIAAATTCDEVVRCDGEEHVASCDVEHACVADSAIHCEPLPDGSGARFARDCSADASGNTQCFDAADAQYAWCGVALCDAALPDTCDGHVAVSCVEGRQLRQDCALQGKTCRPLNADQDVACVTDEACTAEHCEGDKVVSCLGGFVYEKVDCGTRTRDGSCSVAAGRPQCRARHPSPECASVADYHSSCDGDLAVSCLLGAKVTTSCTAVPGAHCVELDSDAARCQL